MLRNIINIVVLLGLVLFVGLFIFDFIWNRRHRASDEAERDALERRRQHPDWEFYERHLQRQAPTALRELFADQALVTSCCLELPKSSGIISFNPIDKDSLLDTADDFGFDVVPFATGGCGDPIFLRPGRSEPDTVFIVYHDDRAQGLVVLADSVAAMVESLRKAVDAAYRRKV